MVIEGKSALVTPHHTHRHTHRQTKRLRGAVQAMKAKLSGKEQTAAAPDEPLSSMCLKAERVGAQQGDRPTSLHLDTQN